MKFLGIEKPFCSKISRFVIYYGKTWLHQRFLKHKMKKVPVSVIVACYNNSTYLRECIESINAQKSPSEIIIVDDCSTDSSYQVAKQLVIEHENIKLLKTESNSGAAAARKIGILAATEDFVAWVDSDDFIEFDAICDAYARLHKEVDLCIFELWRWPVNGQPYKSNANPKNLPLSGNDAVIETLGGWRMHTAGVCRKNIYIDSYKDLNVNSFNSDEILSRLLLRKVRYVTGSPKRYFYRENLQSTTQILNDKHLTRLQSNLWIVNLALELKNPFFRKLVLNSIADAWLIYRKRDIFTKNIFFAELKVFLSSFLRINGIWRILASSPKHFGALLYLIAYTKLIKQ